MSLVHCLGHTKGAIQAGGTCESFVTWHFIAIRSCQHVAQPPSLRTTLCRPSVTAYSIYLQLTSMLEAVPPFSISGRTVPWWQAPPYHGMSNYILHKIFKRPFVSRSSILFLPFWFCRLHTGSYTKIHLFNSTKKYFIRNNLNTNCQKRSQKWIHPTIHNIQNITGIEQGKIQLHHSKAWSPFVHNFKYCWLKSTHNLKKRKECCLLVAKIK